MYFFEKFLIGNFSVDGVRSLVVTFTAIGYMSGKVLYTPLWSAAHTGWINPTGFNVYCGFIVRGNVSYLSVNAP